MHWTRCAVLVIAMLGVTRVGEAQEPAPCTFDRCGLVVATPMTVLAAPIDTGPPRTIWWYFVPHIPELDVATGPALEEYRAAIQYDARFADAHYNLAILLEQRGDAAAAERHRAAYEISCRQSGD